MAKALFLDRDGVINVELSNDYVKTVGEFQFYPKVLEALSKAIKHFDYVFIVTNQRGVGRGKMTLADLTAIHDFMLSEMQNHHIAIHKIYYCTDVDNDSPCRKPNAGMGHQAKKDFPEIDFSQSVMVGNNISDMQFGKTLGMHTVFLTTTKGPQAPHHLIDEEFKSLSHWVDVCF